MLAAAGDTAIETTTAGVTVSVVVALTDPELAVMIDEPVARVDARPALVIVATALAAEVHSTEDVKSSVEPSVKVPVAVNWSVKPLAILGSFGVMAIDVTTAGVTVSVVVPTMDPSVAEMVEEPVASVDARPSLEIVATVL